MILKQLISSELLFLVLKNPQFLSDEAEIENLPLISLPIYKKILKWGPKSKFFFFVEKKITFWSRSTTSKAAA